MVRAQVGQRLPRMCTVVRLARSPRPDMPTSVTHPTNPLHSPVCAWMQGFAQGTADPVAACEHYLARIAQHNPALNAYLWVDAPRSLAMARDSQQRWAQGRPLSPWDGLPIAIKDNVDVQGWPCSAGTQADRERRPSSDAAVVQHLRSLGLVVLGKLNMHEGALGATNANPTYGDCQNPWRAGFTPGGSSGGSAAAVRAQLCAAAIGTDTMGSVRVPASYCGVTAYKPSAGRVSNQGVVPLCHMLDTVGWLTASVADAQALAASLWPSAQDSPTDFEASPSPSMATVTAAATATASARPLRVGRLVQADQVALDPVVAQAYAQLCEQLTQAGVQWVDVDVPLWQPTALRQAGLLLSERDGAAYWTDRLGTDLPGLSEGFARMLRYPERAGAAKLAQAQALLDTVRADAARVFATVDLLLMPTTPQTAFHHNDPVPVNQADFTALANVWGAPALAFPLRTGDLPASAQLLAAPGQDETLWAQVSGLNLDRFAPPPDEDFP
ncbi:GatA Asp-tRNAAsn/Glu-tRNAGln amidotransferase A subunit and related amidases [Burkholderiaceae bacterium]